MTETLDKARAWIEGDPDPETRAELQALIDAGDQAALTSRMDGSLTFGTAGIRGEVGAGPNRMNRAVVIRTTAGLADYLRSESGGTPESPVVVGFDARPTSRQFAEDTAGVLTAAGFRVVYFTEVTPTPVVAFAAKHLGAIAAVVVTASHNPPADNGYKLYGSNAAQIIPPTDTGIATAIAAAPSAIDVPRIEGVFDGATPLADSAPSDILDKYWEEVDSSRPEPVASDLKIVYTAMHGVGGKVVQELMGRAGHTGLLPVPEQFQPDGHFPTVSFPNPEEKGALDLALSMAEAQNADLIIANDPDADRLAAVLPVGGVWRALTGNELGVVLGDYVLRHFVEDQPAIVVNSIVSSPMLGRLADVRGARHEVTLTGFKWIVNAGLALEEAGEGTFVFGYEEALGYSVGKTVRDKDGISAAVVFADLVAGLNAGGKTVFDRLVELWEMTGIWASAQHSVVKAGADGEQAIASAVARLAESPPETLAGHEVVAVTDYRTGAESRPPWLGSQALVELSLGSRGRALVRPSGTEPKLKFYVDLTAAIADDAHAEQVKLTREANELAKGIAGSLGL